MTTTVEQIRIWYERGEADPNNTHMIVVWDFFPYEDFPVYVTKSENVREVAEQNNGPNMTHLIEVYNFALSKEAQLDPAIRCFNY